ncbi:MAG: RNA methyltransferase [Bacteroidota bacterium]|nr:RNA methyltransferase [Bacteroidota bacterium]
MRKLTHDEIAKNRFGAEQLKNEIRFPIYGLLDNIRSLYNVGSIFRTADGARLTKLFLSGYTPYPPRKEIEKTALGATTTVPWEYHHDPLPVIHHLKSQGVRICVLEHTDKSLPYHSLTKDDFPLCIIVGNEITGVSKDLMLHSDMAIDIPMYGMKQSLNAAVAFGIAIFDCVRIFKGD